MKINLAKADTGLILGGAFKLTILRWLPFACKKYDQELRELMGSVNKASFRDYAPYFVGIVKLTKRNSKQFRNSSQETDFVLHQFPRLQQHRSVTLGTVKTHRQKCKLQV